MWIEISYIIPLIYDAYSHPLREGVDWNVKVHILGQFPSASPSTRGCGLKWTMIFKYANILAVTLYARVWIEIVFMISVVASAWSHPLREGVDWNALFYVDILHFCKSPSTRGCGLKSASDAKAGGTEQSPSTRGCGLKYFQRNTEGIPQACHPLCEGVDWNDQACKYANRAV